MESRSILEGLGERVIEWMLNYDHGLRFMTFSTHAHYEGLLWNCKMVICWSYWCWLWPESAAVWTARIGQSTALSSI